MARITKADQEAQARLLAAFEAGSQYFTTHPDQILVETHRYASKLYPEKAEVFEFVAAYSTARSRRDDYLREKADKA